MHTDDVAKSVMSLFGKGVSNEIFNICGQGLISPKEISTYAGKKINLGLMNGKEIPRILDINCEKYIRTVGILPDTTRTIREFLTNF
jgi:hypothetical protein